MVFANNNDITCKNPCKPCCAYLPNWKSDTTQTINNVNFSFTSPTLESVPRWQIVTEGSPFSLQETIISPGLDTITTINRTINTTTTVTVEATFGQ